MADPRDRSRSPTTDKREDKERPRKKKDGGFKWKEKKSTAPAEEVESKSLARGYRDRSPKRESRPATTTRDASIRSLDEPSTSNTDKFGSTTKPKPTKREETPAASVPEPGSVEDKFGLSIDDKFGAGTSAKLAKQEASKPKTQQGDTSQPPVRKAPVSAAAGNANVVKKGGQEAMIIVHVNDRLGKSLALDHTDCRQLTFHRHESSYSSSAV